MSKETWYRVSGWKNEIERFDVVSTTDKTITYEYSDWRSKLIQGTERKHSSSHHWEKTWADAHAWLCGQLHNKLDAYRRTVARLESECAQVAAMQEPK